MRRRSLLGVALTAAALSGLAGSARADRIVLAPRGLIASPATMRVQYLGTTDAPHSDYGWLTVGVPGQNLGLEVEAEGFYLGGRRDSTFSAQYSLTGNAFSDIAPAVSVGVRDVLNRGREGRSAFFAATKTMGLSEAQERIVRDWKLTGGYGTSHLGGAYIGAQARFTLGFSVNAEYVARRLNAGVSIPIGKHLQVQACSLDGQPFYGATLSLTR